MLDKNYQAYIKGKNAFHNMISYSKCPYACQQMLAKNWRDGWNSAFAVYANMQVIKE